MATEALSTRVKNGINAVLRLVGLRVSTTVAETREAARLQQLVDAEHWANPRYKDGWGFNAAGHLEFLRTVCTPFRDAYTHFPRAATNGSEFFLDNGYFEGVDAEMLYSVVRHYAPRRVIEVGSGFSSKLIRKAISEGGLRTELTSIDPQPRIEIQEAAHAHIARPVEELDPAEIAGRLDSGDILFIDSSHNVVTGGDGPYLYIEVLPRLKAGVLIHVHDIFLPYDYPQQWVTDFRRGWTEQYLLHALLLGSRDFEVLWPAFAMTKQHPREVGEVIPFPPNAAPGSFWMRKS